MTKIRIRSCAEALEFLAAFLDGELGDGSQEELERHLATCRSCWSRAEFERRLKEQVGALGTEPVEPALAERIRRIVAGFPVAGQD